MRLVGTAPTSTGRASTGCASTGRASTGRASTGCASTEHASTEHASTEHTSTEHASTEHASTGRASTGQASTGHAGTRPAWARLAWAWLTGQVLLSVGAAVAVGVGVPLWTALLVPIVVGIGGVLFARIAGDAGWRRAGAGRTGGLRRGDGVRRGGGFRREDAGLLTIAGVVGILALALVWRAPGLGWDGQAIWGLKARVLAETGSLPLELLTHPISIAMHPEYPLHVPLLGGVLGSVRASLDPAADDAWSDRTLPLLAAVDALALALLLTRELARRRAPGRHVLLAGGLLVPIFWRELPLGQADVTLALCLLATALGFAAWLRSSRPFEPPLYLAALAAGLGAFVKQEGAVYLALSFVVAATLARERWRALIRPALLALALALPWHVFRFAVGLETEPFGLEGSLFERLPAVARAMIFEGLDLHAWGLLWLAVWPALVTLDLPRRAPRSPASRHAVDRAERFAPRLLIAGLGAIVLIFCATPHDLEWHLETALDRLLLHWWPIALLVIATGLDAARSAADQRWQPGQ